MLDRCAGILSIGLQEAPTELVQVAGVVVFSWSVLRHWVTLRVGCPQLGIALIILVAVLSGRICLGPELVSVDRLEEHVLFFEHLGIISLPC